jgi:hypothetical protein
MRKREVAHRRGGEELAVAGVGDGQMWGQRQTLPHKKRKFET